MSNSIYLESFNSYNDHKDTFTLKVSVESFIIYCIYKYCSPKDTELYFTQVNDSSGRAHLNLLVREVKFIDQENVPWQVSSCVFPVALCDDTVITGLCAVARSICKHGHSIQGTFEHFNGLLGFCKGCLQAPNEVSVWTKFCEVDIIKTVLSLLGLSTISEIPVNLVRFENHLDKPVRIHNIYKVARNIKKQNLDVNLTNANVKPQIKPENSLRKPKNRKWKSNTTKDLEILCSTKLEELSISHQFAEGPFLTLADLLLLPCYYLFTQLLGETNLKELLPLSYKWYVNLINMQEMKIITDIFNIIVETRDLKSLKLPEVDDVSLYKSDPKRHNPKKRLFTKPEDIENALKSISDDLELKISVNNMKGGINWDIIPEGANPFAGHLPDDRVNRKAQQLENLALAVTAMAKDGDVVVDFCSGSGHLGKFDVGVALHACGIASDLVLDKCLKANAKFVLCPCCYGSLHATNRLSYPRSKKFNSIPIDQYLCIYHTADQTHKEHPLSERGDRCMAIIDSDRGRLAEEQGYTVTLARLKPLSCTPKNNLLIGVPADSKLNEVP
ncbi:unnamed protein product [Leptosia nina]|uniref:Glutathione S-transferase C-terminal domain-containing protein n=1 Tax=Leptosia nina TaxID=320188 RepID=A0AAV1K2A9_9NEOP